MSYYSVSLHVVSRRSHNDKESSKTSIVEVQTAWTFGDVLEHMLSMQGLAPRASYDVVKAQVNNADEETLKRPTAIWPKEVELRMNADHIMKIFQAVDILFEVRLAESDFIFDEVPSRGVQAGGQSVANAFTLMREGSRRLSGGLSRLSNAEQPLPPPEYQFINAKIQLEIDVHEVLHSLGFASPPAQHEFLKKILKTVVNYLWYVDPYHHILRRHRGQLPREFAHFAATSYNNFREKKQKPPPLQSTTLDSHVNELFSSLASPTLKLPCNVRCLGVITELANMAALHVSQMRKHAAGIRNRRELMVINDGKVAISFMKKKSGPFRELDKKLICEFRELVRALAMCYAHDPRYMLHTVYSHMCTG